METKSQTSLKLLTDFLATGFYSGKLKYAPGTFGTGAALFLYYVLGEIFPAFSSFSVGLFSAIIIALFAVFVSELSLCYKLYGKDKDPQQIVIDEFAGYFFAAAGVSGTVLFLPTLIWAFLLFRLFDILKPWPICKLQDLHGGIGIVIDDVLAGILANMIIWIFVFLV